MTMYEAFRLIKEFENAKKKSAVYLLECLFSEKEKSLVSGKIDNKKNLCLTEGKAGKNKTQIDAIPKIRKYVQGGGPLYITGNTEFKIKNKHGIDDAVSAAIETLAGHDFVTRYQKGVLNFYRRYKNNFGGTSYMLVGVDVRSKEIKTVYNIFRSVYKRSEKKKLN